ncbi:MAG TPA: hypothetical protein VHT70_00400 [Candidatus Saccharimonadales bacterium]|nr:hypothetical protein [Candidatus Saccharimonadales bacterium]
MKEATSNPEQQPFEPSMILGGEITHINTMPSDAYARAAAEDVPIIEITEPASSREPADEPYPRHLTYKEMTQLQCHGSQLEIERALRGLVPVMQSLGTEMPFSEEDIAEFPELRRTYLGFIRDRLRDFDASFDRPNIPEELPWE